MSKIKKLAGQTAIYGVSTILGRLLNYLLVPLHTYVFTATAQYGVVSELYAYLTFLKIVYTFGMETAFFHFSQKLEDAPQVFSTAFTALILTTALFSSAIFLAYQPIAEWLDYANHPEYIFYVVGIIGFDALAAIPFAKLRFLEKPRKFSLIKVSNILITVFLNVFWLFLCPWIMKENFTEILPGLQNFLYQNLNGLIPYVYTPGIGVGYVFMANLMASGLTLVFLYKEILQFRLRVTFSLLKQMIGYSMPLVFLGLAGMVNEAIDRILLKQLLPYSVEENLSRVGIYAACYKLSIFMTLVVQAFRYAAEPFFFSEAKQGNDPGQTYALILKYFVFLGGMIFLGVAFYIDILKYFIAPAYHEGLNVVPILLMANLFLGIFFNLSIWYKLTEKNYLGALISIFGALVTIGLNIWWIPIFGYTGSAWATFFSYGSMVMISYAFSRKYYPIPYNIPKIGFYLLLAVVLFFAGRYFENEVIGEWNIWSFLLNTALLAIYAIIFISRESTDFLLNLLSNIKQRFKP